jgi:hypothetical protein
MLAEVLLQGRHFGDAGAPVTILENADARRAAHAN